jgi:hypothetical protein
MDVPRTLAELPNWVLWKYVGTDRRKVPFQPTGKPAKSNDPATWSTHAAAAASLNCTYAGLGFVFAADGGLFGIDLDCCLDGDTLAPWAAEILEAFPTYAEISPSGTGIKLFGIGNLVGQGRKKTMGEPQGGRTPAVEVYGAGRYFCFTGRQYGEHTEVLPCQAALDALLARLWPAPVSMPITPIRPLDDVQERAGAYLRVFPPAVAGSGGHNHTFRAACVLVLGFRLSPESAYPILADWNQTCQPPWSEKELRHKLCSADKQGGERGWLLDGRGYDGPDLDLRSLLASLGTPPESQEPESEPSPSEFPPDLIANLPPLMGLAYSWILDTSIKPQPVLTLGAVLAMFATVFGRLVRDDYNTRTNLLMLALSPSGAGKERPRQAVKQILHHAGLDLMNGPERIGSHAGIISSLTQHPARLFQLDEVGRLLMTMKDPKAAPHLWNIGTVIMQLYSSANTIWTGDAYADLNKVKTLNQPCLCLFGTSVPESFYSGLSYENLSDGLLSRMIVLESEGYGERQKPALSDPPEEIGKILAAWKGIAGTGNMAETNPTPKLIPKTPEADARHEQHCNEVHGRHEGEDREHSALWSRAPEKAAKLALLHACCSVSNPADARITVESVDWARALVNHATRSILAKVESRMCLSRWAAEKERAWSKVTSGMSLSDFIRKTQWIRKRDRQDILTEWVEAGAIEIENKPAKTKPLQVIIKRRSRP